MYTTTYPCHECMRLIIGAGVRRVVYVDPYPKSMVPELYAEHLNGSLGGGLIAMEAFVGMSPRLVPLVFGQVGARVRDERGTYIKWIGKQALFVGTEDRYADTTVMHEARAGEDLQRYLTVIGGTLGVPSGQDVNMSDESGTKTP